MPARRPAAVLLAVTCAAVPCLLLPPSAAQGPGDEVSRRLDRWAAEPALRPFAVLSPPPRPALAAPAGRRWSLHVGVNHLDPAKYPGVPDLIAAEGDARDMAEAARAGLFEPKVLIGEQATVRAVLDEMDRATAELRRGDLYVITFAGHGALVPDFNRDQAPRKTDQAFCLYDRMLVDDEVVVRWAKFQPGVRVLILLDSCHSGTSPSAGAQLGTRQKGAVTGDDPLAKLAARSGVTRDARRVRALREVDHESANAVQEADIRAATAHLDPAKAINETRATILRIAACRADQTSLEVGRHGLFTRTMIEIWDGGRFNGTYREMANRAALLTSPYQEPTLDYYGEEIQRFMTDQSFR